jgi:prefoldin subunit 5
LGQADAQLGGLIHENPALKSQLEQIRTNVREAETALKEKEAIIETLSKTVAKEQEKSESRLVTIWKLTSILLGILVVVGVFIAWKLR